MIKRWIRSKGWDTLFFIPKKNLRTQAKIGGFEKVSRRNVLVSIGGVGSTSLGRHIGSLSDKTIYEHTFTPACFADYPPMNIGYMYGNPYDAVLSLFRRGYQDIHVRQILRHSPYKVQRLRRKKLKDFLEMTEDPFHMNEQFENWINWDGGPHRLALIRYEMMGEYIDQILDFFGVEKSFEVRPRKSFYKNESIVVQEGLERLYGELFKKVELMPGYLVKPNSWPGS